MFTTLMFLAALETVTPAGDLCDQALAKDALPYWEGKDMVDFATQCQMEAATARRAALQLERPQLLVLFSSEKGEEDEALDVQYKDGVWQTWDGWAVPVMDRMPWADHALPPPMLPGPTLPDKLVEELQKAAPPRPASSWQDEWDKPPPPAAIEPSPVEPTPATPAIFWWRTSQQQPSRE